jgi:hypothetical protein
MKQFMQNAPYGVTVIQLDNGDEALYLHGECLACADFAQRDDAVCDTGERLAAVLGVPFTLLTQPVPEDDEWAWNDVTALLGWGPGCTLSDGQLTTTVTCTTAHLHRDDDDHLSLLSRGEWAGRWILNTGHGYLLRLDASSYPLLFLKSQGLSRDMRRLLAVCMKRGHVSMVYFSALGDPLPGFPVFDW